MNAQTKPRVTIYLVHTPVNVLMDSLGPDLLAQVKRLCSLYYIGDHQIVLFVFKYHEICCCSMTTDVNECLSDNGGCESACVNTYGGVECDCVQGYIPDPMDNTKCKGRL